MKELILSKKSIPCVVLCLIFFFIKISGLSIRMSDSNIYFYNGYQILHGQLLYRDIFFTNFPILPYISALYFLLVGGNLKLFYLTPIIETLITTGCIYFFLLHKTKQIVIATTSTAMYLFSFLILSTSDHQTGVFLASLFSVISYLAFDRKHYWLTGIFSALLILTKAYFIPLVLTYGAFLLIKKEYRSLGGFITGGIITGIIILLPFLLFARTEFIKDVFVYSLTRGEGIDKLGLIQFFILHDFLFVSLLIANLVLIRKNLLFGLFSIFSLLFIFLYQDIYYLYLNFMAPILTISLYEVWKGVVPKLKIQKMVIPTIISVFLLINLFVYLSHYASLQKYTNIDLLVSEIKEEKPQYLYGPNDLTPALSYLSGIPMLDNITDTNTNLYRKRFLNAHTLTEQALEKKTIIVGHGAMYPQYGINQIMFDEVFDQKLIKTCKTIAATSVVAEGGINAVALQKCYK